MVLKCNYNLKTNYNNTLFILINTSHYYEIINNNIKKYDFDFNNIPFITYNI